MPATKIPAHIYTPRKPGDLNIPLLVETLAQIEMAPNTWQQSDWRALSYDENGQPTVQEGTRCGANLCFAGHAAMIASGQWLVDGKTVRKAAEKGLLPEIGGGLAFGALKPTREELELDKSEDERLYGSYDELTGIEEVEVPVIEGDQIEYKTMKGIHASARARLALGLSDEDASALFNGDNDLNTIRTLVCEYILKHLANHPEQE